MQHVVCMPSAHMYMSRCVCVCVFVFWRVCMHVFMYACMLPRKHACMHVSIYARTKNDMQILLYINGVTIHVRVFACMRICKGIPKQANAQNSV